MCIQVEGNKPGVVYCTDRSISCTVCKHQRHSCSHIQQLCDYISNETTIPEILQPFSDVTTSTSSLSWEAKPVYKLLSRRKIPFNTTSELANILTTPLSERFHMVNGICYLKENSSDTICTLCGQTRWEENNEMVSESAVITHNQTFLAKSNGLCQCTCISLCVCVCVLLSSNQSFYRLIEWVEVTKGVL